MKVCAVCDGRVEYRDPTGAGLGFWEHLVAPEDGHDAIPEVFQNG